MRTGTGRAGKPVSLARVWTGDVGSYASGLVWSPDGKQVAVSGIEGPVTVFDAASGERRHELSGHGSGTTALSWSPDGRLLASAGQDGKVRLWSMTGTGGSQELNGGSAWVEKAAWSPDGRYLVSAAGRRLRLWKPDGTLLWESRDQQSTITDVQWRPDSSRELATTAYGGLTLWKPGSPEPARRFEWKGSSLVAAWSPNGKFIATGDQDSTVHFWISKTGHDLQMYGYPTKVRELSWNTTSRYLATGGGPAVTVWDCSGKGPAGSQPLAFEAHEDAVNDLAFGLRGPRLLSGGEDGLVAVWEPGGRSGAVALQALDTGVARLAWAPGDKRIAVGGSDGTVTVFEAP